MLRTRGRLEGEVKTSEAEMQVEKANATAELDGTAEELMEEIKAMLAQPPQPTPF